jgi:hypothetical protein
MQLKRVAYIRDDSVAERAWARIWGAPFVALLAGLVVAIIYWEWTKHEPPSKDRAAAIVKCREKYREARTVADSTRVDAEIVIWRVARSATRDLTCRELRLSADW